ncbi:hypothetical protein F751_3447 [Auxenochlorella protothecoides]|uniref:Uncharacterized protein n=1 Tax=Auxenochlorella protothecoides TaxID=3075 RepID=A0A087SC02_AUXPR|nr:hypothetical protein F751_3447 [Auxenochlorella protothecoides]KFM23256.1 hypothetical protein F751_3447 [Auxenochlorella protothecoides]
MDQGWLSYRCTPLLPSTPRLRTSASLEPCTLSLGNPRNPPCSPFSGFCLNTVRGAWLGCCRRATTGHLRGRVSCRARSTLTREPAIGPALLPFPHLNAYPPCPPLPGFREAVEAALSRGLLSQNRYSADSPLRSAPTL